MYSVLSMWRESFDFFKHDRLKTFFLLTLNALRDVYVAVALHALWVPLVFLIPVSIVAVIDAAVSVLSTTFLILFVVFLIMLSVCFSLILFVTVCAARSSVDPKIARYFWEKITRFFLPFAVFCGVAQVLFVLLLLARLDVSVESLTGATVLLKNVFSSWWVSGVLLPHIWVLLVLFGFFLIDAGPYRDTRRRAAVNMVRMAVYQYPVFLFLMLFNTGLLFVWFGLTRLICSLIFMSACAEMLALFCADFLFLIGFMMPLSVVMIANVYIKNVYEYNKAYFPL